MLKCFLGGRDGGVSGIGRVMVVEVVMARYWWRLWHCGGGGNFDG